MPDHSIRIRFFEDDAVVYNEVSAETHLLSTGSASLLQAILSGCVDTAVLHNFIALEADPEAEDVDCDSQLKRYIADFRKRDLVDARELFDSL